MLFKEFFQTKPKRQSAAQRKAKVELDRDCEALHQEAHDWLMRQLDLHREIPFEDISAEVAKRSHSPEGTPDTGERGKGIGSIGRYL